METTKLEAEVRSESGKGPARRLRAAGKLPAVIYGPGVDPTALAVDPAALEKALRGERGRNTVFELNVGGDAKTAIIKDVTVHPVSRALLHADFYVVSLDREVDTTVPVEAVGRPSGVKAGGRAKLYYRSIPVRGIPFSIPAKVTLQVDDIEIGDLIRVSDIELPTDVVITLDPQQTVFGVYEDRRAAAKAKFAGGEGEGEGEGEAEG